VPDPGTVLALEKKSASNRDHLPAEVAGTMRTSTVSRNEAAAEEQRVNLIKDGGRRVMYGGDPYEDDLEPAAPWGSGEQAAGAPTATLPAPERYS
jgi:hypothetical protein